VRGGEEKREQKGDERRAGEGKGGEGRGEERKEEERKEEERKEEGRRGEDRRGAKEEEGEERREKSKRRGGITQGQMQKPLLLCGEGHSGGGGFRRVSTCTHRSSNPQGTGTPGCCLGKHVPIAAGD
jgi:hypothetical protein